MTVLEVIQKSTEYLDRKGVDSPRLQSELLLAHVLKMPRLKLYLEFERQLAAPVLDLMRAFVIRRGHREPLQHLLGTANFCGLDLTVNRHVLIPRPETELLAETAQEFMQHWLQNTGPTTAEPRVLDFGTGSGCLALYLALRFPQTRVSAMDISPEAVALARANAEHCGASRVEFLTGDGLTALPHGSTFALIVSNPPYIPTSEIATLQPEVRDYDPHRALDGGADGLDFYRLLSETGPRYLLPDGGCVVEIGDGQAAQVTALFEAQRWTVTKIRNDYQGKPRIITATRTAAISAP